MVRRTRWSGAYLEKHKLGESICFYHFPEQQIGYRVPYNLISHVKITALNLTEDDLEELSDSQGGKHGESERLKSVPQTVR